jgi:uncharacterized protein DUF6152
MVSKLLSLAGIVLLATLPLLAHHPFSAEYDWKKPVTVSGTITKVDWSNPHSHIYVDAKDADGKMKNWSFELGGVSALTRAGWSKTTLKNGDTVTVDAWLSRNQSNMGNVKSVTLSSGKELSGASSIVEPASSTKASVAKVKY